MDLESPWSDFYDLLLQDEASSSETEDEWTSVQKTSRGHIECQPMSTTMDETTPIDPEFQAFVNQVLATVSSPPAQRHYHFHHHNHHSDTAASSNWTQNATTASNTNSGRPCSWSSDNYQRKDNRLPLMPGTFIINDNEDANHQKIECPCVVSSKSLSKRSIPTATTSTRRFMDVHAWITSMAFLVHLLLLWFRP